MAIEVHNITVEYPPLHNPRKNSKRDLQNRHLKELWVSGRDMDFYRRQRGGRILNGKIQLEGGQGDGTIVHQGGKSVPEKSTAI